MGTRHIKQHELAKATLWVSQHIQDGDKRSKGDIQADIKRDTGIYVDQRALNNILEGLGITVHRAGTNGAAWAFERIAAVVKFLDREFPDWDKHQ